MTSQIITEIILMLLLIFNTLLYVVMHFGQIFSYTLIILIFFTALSNRNLQNVHVYSFVCFLVLVHGAPTQYTNCYIEEENYVERELLGVGVLR